ncbi:MAG: eCIS core domain-containing protein, partial [bacterium]
IQDPAQAVLALHGAIGNQAVQRLLRSGGVQAKLAVSQPDDPYEREADRVAAQVLQMPESAVEGKSIQHHGLSAQIQRQCGPCREEEETIQRMETPAAAPETTPAAGSDVLAPPGAGHALPGSARAFFEPRFGYDFSQVRVHVDERAAESARAVNALAYTVGQDVVFGAGEYAPGTTTGNRLMAHELAHVVQQGPNTFLPVSMGQVILQRSPRKRARVRDKSITTDPKTARSVMGQILEIIAETHKPVHPSQWATEPPISKYGELLSLWFELTHEKKADGSKLEGEAYASAFERARAETAPILRASLQGARNDWRQLVSNVWFENFVRLEQNAESQLRIAGLLETTTSFVHASSPEPIALDEFLRVASANNTRRVLLQRGAGIALWAAAGNTYHASADDARLLLWASPAGVFFLSGDQIYKQSIAGFSDDIILGAIIKAAQDVAPFVNLITAVVDIAISLTPVGFVYDLTMASKAIAEGKWMDAALQLLPGPVFAEATKLAKATRIGAAAFRGGAKGAKLLGKAIKGTASFIGKGFGKGKTGRGLWLVAEGAGEAAGTKAYYYMDEADDIWRAVPEEEAAAFIRCTKCDLTKAGKGDPKGGELVAEAEAKETRLALIRQQAERRRLETKYAARAKTTYPAETWAYIEQLEGSFPKLKGAQLRPLKRPASAEQWVFNERMQTSQGKFSFQGETRSGKTVQLDDITPDGWVVEVKYRDKTKWENEAKIVDQMERQSELARESGLLGVRMEVTNQKTMDTMWGLIKEHKIEKILPVLVE